MSKKKIWLWAGILTCASLLGYKISLNIADNNFENEIEQMKTEDKLSFEIKTHITHKILEQEGYRIHYYVTENDSKEKPAIFFLHPAFSDHTCFYKQIDFFSEHFQVFTIDFLGHGESQKAQAKDGIEQSARHISEIMQNENIELIHIAGVSMGTIIAQHFALQYPEKVLSLTSLGGYNINHEDPDIQKLQQKESFRWILKVLFSMKSFRRYVASISVLKEVEQIPFYESTKGFSRRSFLVMSGLSQLIAERPNPVRSYPLLILSGEKDNPLAIQAAERWYLDEPQSTFYIIPDAGHCANMDQAESFNQIVYKAITEQKKTDPSE